MKKYVYIFLIAITCISINAKTNDRKVEKKKVTVVSDVVDAHEMYIYGVAFSTTDSIVYITDEQKLEGAQIRLQNKYLVNRAELSEQLKSQMALEGEKNFSCCVVYSQNLKELDKKFLKHIAFLKKKGFDIHYINQDRFLFKAVRVEYNDEGYATEEIEVPILKE